MKRLEEKLDRYNYYSDSVTLHLKQTGLTHVILNGAKRSEESLRNSLVKRRFRDFSLPLVAQNDMFA